MYLANCSFLHSCTSIANRSISWTKAVASYYLIDMVVLMKTDVLVVLPVHRTQVHSDVRHPVVDNTRYSLNLSRPVLLSQIPVIILALNCESTRVQNLD